MPNEKMFVEFALLSWIRLYHSIEKHGGKGKVAQTELEKYVDYLSSQHIKDLEIIYKSENYYTLRYLREGQTCIKQFKATDVELHI